MGPCPMTITRTQKTNKAMPIRHAKIDRDGRRESTDRFLPQPCRKYQSAGEADRTCCGWMLISASSKKRRLRCRCGVHVRGMIPDGGHGCADATLLPHHRTGAPRLQRIDPLDRPPPTPIAGKRGNYGQQLDKLTAFMNMLRDMYK